MHDRPVGQAIAHASVLAYIVFARAIVAAHHYDARAALMIIHSIAGDASLAPLQRSIDDATLSNSMAIFSDDSDLLPQAREKMASLIVELERRLDQPDDSPVS